MAKTNRTCKVCGLEYYFCPACSATKANPQPKWKINYCSENCKTIFDTVVKYNCEDITKEDLDLKTRAFWFPPYDGAYIEVNGKKYTLVDKEILDTLIDSETTALF